jgi:signal transduction histidine kinase
VGPPSKWTRSGSRPTWPRPPSGPPAPSPGSRTSAGGPPSTSSAANRHPAATDRALTDLRAEIDEKGHAVATAFEPAFATLDALETARTDVDQSTTPHTPWTNLVFSQEIFERYSGIITSFFDATTRVSMAVDDPELRAGTRLADTVARQSDTMAVLIVNLYVTGFTPGGVDQPPEIAKLSQLKLAFDRNARELRTARGPYAALAADHYPAALTDGLAAVVDQANATSVVDGSALSAAIDQPANGDYAEYQEALADAIVRRAGELNAAAQSRQRWFMVLSAIVLVLATAVAVAMSWSITRPLRSLTRQAKDIAQRRLPEAVAAVLATPPGENVERPEVPPVHVDSHDEVSDLVETLDRVQHVALDLAVEQVTLRRTLADTFVNLGRRNQNLLGRQLDFITELEGRETDPDVLANLFSLDHLATRMRRNAESLLVLAGAEPSRRWAAPVPLSDVVRAALGEVEDYRRVSLRGIEPVTVLGFAAGDLTHLLAELVENALVFSQRDRPVEIHGIHGRHGAEYVLAVVDGGRGMPAGEVATANRRLAGVERFTVAPSKYLGHYVAGQLARRHGIAIQLESSPWTGTTATISLPGKLLTTTVEASETARS